MAKAFAIRMIRETTDAALTLFGGLGYVEGSPIERLYRDARSLWFEEGTTDMQKMSIAEELLIRARHGNVADGSGEISCGIPEQREGAL